MWTFPRRLLEPQVHLQPEYSDAGQPASACYCSAVWASSLVKIETERQTFLCLPLLSHTLLSAVSEHPPVPHIRVHLCRCHAHGFASSAPHCTGISANSSDSLGIRHPVICIVRKGNTLSTQQEYLEGNGSILRRGARLRCMSTWILQSDVSQGLELCYRYQGGFQLLRALAELLQESPKSSTQSQRS